MRNKKIIDRTKKETNKVVVVDEDNLSVENEDIESSVPVIVEDSLIIDDLSLK